MVEHSEKEAWLAEHCFRPSVWGLGFGNSVSIISAAIWVLSTLLQLHLQLKVEWFPNREVQEEEIGTRRTLQASWILAFGLNENFIIS